METGVLEMETGVIEMETGVLEMETGASRIFFDHCAFWASELRSRRRTAAFASLVPSQRHSTH